MMKNVFSRERGRLVSNLCLLISILVSGNSASAIEDIAPRIYANSFLLKQKGTEQCLVVLDELEGCLSSEGRTAEGCDNSNRVVFQTCDQYQPEQRWVFDFLNKRIHSPERRREICLTRMPDKLSMEVCKSNNLKQLWFFNQQDEFLSRIDFFNPPGFLKLLQKKAEHRSPIIFQFSDSETGDDQCYLSPFTGRVECPGFEYDEASLQQQGAEFWNGSGQWPWQPKPVKLTEDLQLGDNNRCLTVEQCHIDSVGQYDCFGGARVQAQVCKSVSTQIWRYDLVSKRLFNKQAGEQFCLSWQSGKLTLEYCLPGRAVSQRWYFARGTDHQYSQRGYLRWFSNQWEHYEYTKFLGFDLIVKFEILENNNQGVGCGYDPIDGIWKGSCSN